MVWGIFAGCVRDFAFINPVFSHQSGKLEYSFVALLVWVAQSAGVLPHWSQRARFCIAADPEWLLIPIDLMFRSSSTFVSSNLYSIKLPLAIKHCNAVGLFSYCSCNFKTLCFHIFRDNYPKSRMPRAQSYPDNHQEFSGRQNWLATMAFPGTSSCKQLKGKFILRGVTLHKLVMVAEGIATKCNPNRHSERCNETYLVKFFFWSMCVTPVLLCLVGRTSAAGKKTTDAVPTGTQVG